VTFFYFEHHTTKLKEKMHDACGLFTRLKIIATTTLKTMTFLKLKIKILDKKI